MLAAGPLRSVRSGDREDARPPGPAILERYRTRFRPGPTMPAPWCNLIVAGICVKSEREATEALSRHANPYIVPNVVGTPRQCGEQLAEFAERAAAR